MKIICTQENLSRGLSIVSHVSSKSTNLPILNNVLFTVEKNTIKLSATNLEIGIHCHIRGKVEKEGMYTVQAKLLADYINLLPKERVDIEVLEDGNSSYLHIQCKNYSTKIKGLPASDFPLIPKIEKKRIYKCDLEDLRVSLSQVVFAVSINESRPEIGGVFFHFQGDGLTLAATDSFRLSEKRLMSNSVRSAQGKDMKIIVPSRTIQEVFRVLGGYKDQSDIENVDMVEIAISENQILFSVGNIEITSRLIEGHYPDYKQIIPKDFVTEVYMKQQEFVKAVKTASLFTRSGIYDVSLECLPDTKELVVRSGNSQIGENESRISAEVTGKKNSIILNYRYLLDGLQNINSDEVQFCIIDNTNPCVIQKKDSPDYMNIIMPIKQ